MTGDQVLTPREVALVAAIVASPGDSQEDIAKALRISKRHVRRLLAGERVRRALDEAARAGLAEAASTLGRGSQRAAQALLGMATGSTRATSPRVAAARAVLDGAGRLIDLVDLERRILGLEKTRAPGGWTGGRPQ